MEYIKLDKKAITSWRVGRLLRMPIWIILCAVILFFSWWDLMDGTPEIILKLVAALLLIYKIAGIIIYPQIEYKQWGYHIAEDKVDIRHGIFFVSNTVIPIIRIQHITVSQGPVNRKLGLYDVEISLASGSFTIECLAKEVADEIADNLKARLYTRLEAQ